MTNIIHINTPLSDAVVEELKIGDKVKISGTLYTARDAAHKRLVTLVEQGKELPFDIKNQIIYYVGPSPAPPGMPIGSCGPTTSYRMDKYAPLLLSLGLKATIGKGGRSGEVVEAMKKYKAVYFVATGGAAALLAQSVKKMEIVAYEDLGTEAIRKLEVENFPAIVANDIYGNDLYKDGIFQYAVSIQCNS